MEKDIKPLIEHLLDVLNAACRETAVARREVALMKERLSYREQKEEEDEGDEAGEEDIGGADDETDSKGWTRRDWRLKGQMVMDPPGYKCSPVPPEPRPATDSQIALLDKEGVDYPPELTRSQADQMIEALWYHQETR